MQNKKAATTPHRNRFHFSFIASRLYLDIILISQILSKHHSAATSHT